MNNLEFLVRMERLFRLLQFTMVDDRLVQVCTYMRQLIFRYCCCVRSGFDDLAAICAKKAAETYCNMINERTGNKELWSLHELIEELPLWSKGPPHNMVTNARLSAMLVHNGGDAEWWLQGCRYYGNIGAHSELPARHTDIEDCTISVQMVCAGVYAWVRALAMNASKL